MCSVFDKAWFGLFRQEASLPIARQFTNVWRDMEIYHAQKSLYGRWTGRQRSSAVVLMWVYNHFTKSSEDYLSLVSCGACYLYIFELWPHFKRGKIERYMTTVNHGYLECVSVPGFNSLGSCQYYFSYLVTAFTQIKFMWYEYMPLHYTVIDLNMKNLR